MRSETYEIRTQRVEPFVPKGCSVAKTRVVRDAVMGIVKKAVGMEDEG